MGVLVCGSLINPGTKWYIIVYQAGYASLQMVLAIYLAMLVGRQRRRSSHSMGSWGTPSTLTHAEL